MALTKIKTDGVTDDAITSGKIPDNAVGTTELAANAVTTAKIADSTGSTDGVTSSKLASDAVTTTKIQDTAVTLAKLEHGTSSNDGKFLRANNGADPTFETVSTTPADGSIIEAKLANNAVTHSKIADTAVSQAKLNYPVANRNLIINGAMQVAQRGSAEVTAANNTNTYRADRFKFAESTGGTVAMSVQDGTGEFAKSLKVRVTGTDTSVANIDRASIQTVIEDLDVKHLQWGTANAKTVTISFWVKSNAAQTYCLNLYNSGTNNRTYIAEYAVSSPNTWEKKTLTISGDTTGTWGHIGVRWVLTAGTDYQGSTGWNAWSGSGGLEMATSNQYNWMGATNDFYLTGVQLELGNVSTNFEHKSYGEELDICKRYYQQYGIDANGSAMRLSMPFINEHPTNTGGYINFRWEREMRTTPTATIGSSLELGEPQVGLSSYKVSSFNNLNAQGTDYFQFSGGQLGSTGDTNKYIRFGHDSNAWAKFSAEL